nr:UDP-4-amino-4,6-dideoxy-N-acetyl-beta-L-altrosamine N-acetyltransferase [Campylobacter upsaliensis]
MKLLENKRILIVAAHPDDEVLGCFGSVARFICEGYEAYTLILGEGKSSRASANLSWELELLEEEFKEANFSIGIKKIFREHFPDNAFDSVPLLELVRAIEKIKERVKPSIIFTHFEKDLNIDHQMTYRAVLTASRALEDESVEQIYSFEVLSSTEWNYPLSFTPDVFFDISQTLKYKIKAMKCYKSELRDYPHPRSLKGICLQAQMRGLAVGLKYAEAFKLVRDVRKTGQMRLKNFTDLNYKELREVLEWRNEVSDLMKTQNISLKEHLEFIEKLENSEDKSYFLVRDGDKDVGVIYFFDINEKECEFGLYAKPNLRGVGQLLMNEVLNYAFDTLKVQILKACVFKTNERALTLYLKNDFKIINEDETMLYLCKRGGGGNPLL